MNHNDIIVGHIYGNFGTDMRRVVAIREEPSVFDFEAPRVHVDFIVYACGLRKTHLLPWEHDQAEADSLPMFEFAAWAMRRFSDHDAAARAIDLRATRFKPTKTQRRMLIDAVMAGPAGHDGGTPFSLHPARRRVAAALQLHGILTLSSGADGQERHAMLTVYGVLVADLVCKRNGVRCPHQIDLPSARQALIDHLDMAGESVPTDADSIEAPALVAEIMASAASAPQPVARSVCARQSPAVFDDTTVEMPSAAFSPF